MKKHSTLLKTQVILGIVASIFVTFAITAGLGFVQYSSFVRQHFIRFVRLTAEKKALELNTCLVSIEKSVESAEDYITRTIDEERILADADYEAKYMTQLAKELVAFADFAKGAVSVYFRMNVDRFGGNRGIFLENTASGFISIKPTDLTQYAPTDTEHVGWYYLPVWEKAPVWTAPYENKNINMHMISFASPIYKDEKLLGVVGMDINLATVKDIIDLLPIEDSIAVIIGKKDNLVYYNNAHSVKKSVEDSAETAGMVKLLAASDDTRLQKFQWDLKPHYGMMVPLENGMKLVVALSRRAFAKVQKQQMASFSLAFAFISLLTGVILFMVLRYLVAPIRIIRSTTFKLARGELNLEIPYHSNNELGALADNIRMMTRQMKEYIDHISEQTKKEREAKEAALSESKSKSEFLASIYLSLHEIDLNNDTFSEIQSHTDITKSVGTAHTQAQAVIRRVMEERVMDTGKARKEFMNFINFDTLEERLKNKISVAQEFHGRLGFWCRARFILVDRNSDGTLHHVLWAIENIQEEKAERDRLQGERDKLRIEAEKNLAASQAKSAFLANMSHEIRTPINAVLGMDEMILRESRDEDITGYAANIKTAGTNLLSIVNEILDFSKIEAGKMEILPENYDISSVVVDLVNMITERAKDKGLEFNLKTDPSLPKTLFGDSIRIKQCVLNLLTNAVKYTHEGSVSFSVGYTKIDDEKILLNIAVKDSGIGIKEEDMEKLCSPFERIEEGKNKTIEGTGLGMSIVTRLLAMMGSKLEVQSEYGKGSEFSFSIVQLVADWTEVGDINESYKKSVAQIAAYKEKLLAPRAQLLFVDDTEMNLEVIKGLLKNTGMTIDTVLSGAQALEKVKKHCYDILFIDHRMPDMDGIETLHAMQNLDGNLCKGKPCIALTANALTGVKKMYLEEGFSDYLSKPVDPGKLEDMIRAYLPEDLLEEPPEEEGIFGISESAEDTSILEKLRRVEGIDADAALAHCAAADILESALKTYYITIESKAAELEAFYKAEDWKNYCTKVHALKSTSRLIGAMDVSGKAAHLEECAHNSDVEEIREKHGQLMELFKAFKQKLEPLVYPEGTEPENKEEISESALKEKLVQIGEYADSFDIDGLDALIAELSAFAMPPSFAETFAKIRSCVENVDFTAVKELVEDNIEE